MLGLLALITTVAAVLGLRLRYEEDLTKLFPTSDPDIQLAFSNLKAKDKITVQLVCSDAEADLASLMDEFMDDLMTRDSSSRLIQDAFYKVEPDVLFGALDYALGHVPSFVDTSMYRQFDKALTREEVFSSIRKTKAAMMEDETGTAMTMGSMDPLGLTGIITGDILSDGSGAGFSLVDNHLFSPDSTVAIGFISPNFGSLESGSGKKLVRMIEKASEDFSEAHQGAEVLMHGATVSSAGHSGRIVKDLVLTMGLSLLIILLFIAIAFRTGNIVWQQLLPVVFGAVTALALMYAVKGQISIMALGISAIILGVALSYSLHVTIHYNYVQDAEKMLRDESKAVSMGCITTVGAFLGLLFTNSEILKDFGLFATFVLVGNTLFALVFLPHFLKPPRRERNGRLFAAMDRMCSYPYDRNPWILAAVVAVVAVGIVFSPRVKFDSSLYSLDYHSPKLEKSLKLYEEKFSGSSYQVYFATVGATPDEAVERAMPLVREMENARDGRLIENFSCAATAAFVPERTQEARIKAWKDYWTEERTAALRKDIAAACAEEQIPALTFEPFFALVQDDYAPGALYFSDVIPESISSNFIEESRDGKFLVLSQVNLEFKDFDNVAGILTAVPHTIVLDPFYYCTDIVDVIHSDFNTALMISSIFVLVILLLAFRNVWVALIAFLPMSLSWYVVQGLMAIFGLEFNLINIIISTFIFGIGVDYSIFVMEGLLNKASTGRDGLLRLHKTAIVFSAFGLIVVTLSLIFAVHPAIKSIGLSTLIGMVCTIVITWTLEPLLFRLFVKWGIIKPRAKR